MWFLAFLVIAPTVFVYFLIIKGMDRYEPEPFWLLTLAFFWGAVAATLMAIVMNGVGEEVLSAALHAPEASQIVQSSTASFVAPLVEESCKGSGMLLLWLFRGRAALKQQLAMRAEVDVEALPLNHDLIAYAAEQAGKGRQIFIATAADRAIADRVAQRIPFVSGVIASDGRINLKGTAKARALRERFPAGFDYAGDARADLSVWKAARSAVVVEASSAVATSAPHSRMIRAASAIRRPFSGWSSSG